MAKTTTDDGVSGAERIDAILAGTPDWRGSLLAELRHLIRTADPEVEEDTKWSKPSNPAGVATWSHDGIICTGELYKAKVKLSFFHGAALDDPAGLFNASLDAGTRRCIDLAEGDAVDPKAFKELIRAAVAHNTAG
jgi:hypothetical protein